MESWQAPAGSDQNRFGIPIFDIDEFTTMGVLFRLVWLKIDGTGLDGFYSIYEGHVLLQKAAYVHLF